jgi:hypothetical protein
VWDYLLFERSTWTDRAKIERRRADWPLWRRGVRPIGALAWWIGIAVSVATNETLADQRHHWTDVGTFLVLVTVVLLSCVDIGIGTLIRERTIESVPRASL